MRTCTSKQVTDLSKSKLTSRMWGLQYDENLHKNEFFEKIATGHKDLLVKASKNDWIICVPRAGVIDTCDLTTETISDHILIPNDESGRFFTSLTNRPVLFRNRQVAVIGVPSTTTSILFEETFYIKDTKCTVLCIDAPLSTNLKTRDPRTPRPALDTLSDCIDYLWSANLSHTLVKIQHLCAAFAEQNRAFALDTLQTQKDQIGSLYSHCLQLVFKNERPDATCDHLKLAVETYMQSCLDATLLQALNTVTCGDDSALNKIARDAADLQMKDLNIGHRLAGVVAAAKTELGKINNYSTVLDKLNCLKLTFDHLCGLTCDDVLQIVVFLIVKLNVANWTSNLVYLTEFRFASTSSEHDFLVTSLEAAIEFIRSDRFPKAAIQTTNPAFGAVASGDLCLLRESLRTSSKSDDVSLCHPLCSCSTCTDRAGSNTDNCRINEKGQSLLTIATILHRSEIVEYLLSFGVPIDSTDYSGRTALHYACLKGHQDLLLILINSKACVNLKDHDGNTALHLACNNGHEPCVKALFYTSPRLDSDSVNKHGDTALHLAVKWNHTGIVRVLLENNTIATIPNRKHQLPVDLAQNYYTQQLLRQHHVYMEPSPSASCKDHGLKPKTLDQFKKIDLLLKAIENNDSPLTCFYLGFSSANTGYSFASKCHPLCNCDKCEDTSADPQLSVERINVNTCNCDGFTPLHFAAKHGRLELLRILLDSCALPNLKTYKTLQTSLHLACVNGQVEVVKELVNCGNCELDPRDYKDHTPLYYACKRNDFKIVELLLSNGASSDLDKCQGRDIIKEVRDKYLSKGKDPDFL